MNKINRRRVATISSSAIVAVFVAVLFGAGAFAAITSAAHPSTSLNGTFHERQESASLEQNETMPNFVNGIIYQSEYEQNYFVGSNSTMQPTVGTPANVFPTPNLSSIGEFYVLVPWWGPSATPYAPAYNLSTPVMCAPATVQVCFDHPGTVSVPGLGVVPTPGHDHLLDGLHGFKDIWWKVTIVLVLHQSAWPGINGMQGITSDHNRTNPAPFTESLDQAELNGDAVETTSNFFLDFAVLSLGDV
jgi:hypothetical protein